MRENYRRALSIITYLLQGPHDEGRLCLHYPFNHFVQKVRISGSRNWQEKQAPVNLLTYFSRVIHFI